MGASDTPIVLGLLLHAAGRWLIFMIHVKKPEELRRNRVVGVSEGESGIQVALEALAAPLSQVLRVKCARREHRSLCQRASCTAFELKLGPEKIVKSHKVAESVHRDAAGAGVLTRADLVLPEAVLPEAFALGSDADDDVPLASRRRRAWRPHASKSARLRPSRTCEMPAAEETPSVIHHEP